MESTINKMQEFYDDVVEKAGIAAAAINAGKPEKETSKLKKAATDAMATYNTEAARVAFVKWAEEGNPIEQAVRTYYVPEAKKVMFKKAKGTEQVYVEYGPAEIAIDLFQLEDVVGKDKFHDPDWFKPVENLALLIANATNKDMGGNIAFAYAVSEAAREFKFSEEADPKSAKSMAKALQQTVDGILYLPVADQSGRELNGLKVTTAAWHYIRESMTKRGKKPGSVQIMSPAAACELVLDVMYIIINNKKFEAVCA